MGNNFESLAAKVVTASCRLMWLYLYCFNIFNLSNIIKFCLWHLCSNSDFSQFSYLKQLNESLQYNLHNMLSLTVSHYHTLETFQKCLQCSYTCVIRMPRCAHSRPTPMRNQSSSRRYIIIITVACTINIF